MQALLDVILPVFLVIGAGYFTVWRSWLTQAHISGLMQFAVGIAIPALLFRAIWKLDLSASFDWRILVAFYGGAALSFFAGMLGARFFFGRDMESAIAVGFVCLFSNSLMLGLAITERAFGAPALEHNYVIVAIHAPFCYGLGIAAMELQRARGGPLRHFPGKVARAMFKNNLVIGISLGFFFNLTGIPIPGPASDALDLLVRTALPVALFGMGGVLVQYRPRGDLRVIAYACVISLILHPSLVWVFGKGLDLSLGQFRSAILTSAMAPGINAYLFANMYGRGERVAASSVLIATAVSLLTAWFWLSHLP